MALFVDLVALSNGLHGSVQMDSVALFSWIGWLRHHGILIGFLYLKQTGKDTVELAVMGVLKEYHRKGIGRALFEYAKESIKESGYSFIQVKTVKMGMYEDYDCTNRFYISLGFKEFEVLNSLWDENNPCQIYVMGI